jgi:Ketosteroid isomerase homolog
MTVELLKAFLDAFNRHDLDAIMEFFADECVFYMPRGADPCAWRGPARVREREDHAQGFLLEDPVARGASHADE